MNIKFWKWWTIVNIGVWSIFLGNWYYGLFDFLQKSDPTYITFIILAIGFSFVLFLAINYKKIINSKENTIYWFTSDSVLSLGMIGTLLGFLMVLGQAFVDIDPSNINSMTQAIAKLATGMSTALVTTLVGLTVGLWMKLQLVVLEET